MPKALKVVTLPTQTLHQRSVPVAREEIGTPGFQEFLDDLILTMHAAGGVGIAAPQVGNNLRVFVVDNKADVEVYINPEIEMLSESMLESEEGCLSVPGIWGVVPRAKRIRLKALNRHGRRSEVEAKGFHAIVLQHEFDHLEGVLFVDKALKTTKGTDRKAV